MHREQLSRGLESVALLTMARADEPRADLRLRFADSSKSEACPIQAPRLMTPVRDRGPSRGRSPMDRIGGAR